MTTVRARIGSPILTDFGSGRGTPLVVNSENGRGYVLLDDNSISPLGGAPLDLRDFSGLDPTGDNDSTTAIQAAFDQAATARVGEIIVPPGTYSHTDLTLAPASSQIHVNLHGLGGTGAFGIIFSYIGSGTALTIANNTRYTFENIRLVNAGTGTRGLFLTSLTTGSNHGPARYDNCFVYGFDTNIQIGDTSNKAASELLFVNTETSNADLGILVQGPASGTSFSTNIRFIGLQSVGCGTALTVAGDNEGTQIKAAIWGFAFSFNDRELDFQVPGIYQISNGYAESDTDGELLRSGSADPTENSAFVTKVNVFSVITNYPSSPSNFVARCYQPGNYSFHDTTLSTGSIELGGFDGGAGPRKSSLVLDSCTIASASPRVAYRAGSNTIWNVRHTASGNTNTEAVNTDEDRHYIINTAGTELTIAKYGAWSASAGGDALNAALGTRVVATASLPAASTDMNGTMLIEDAGAGDRNLILYGGGQRFRIDGGAAF